jgi:TATA-binding protein-associated factor Taf7
MVLLKLNLSSLPKDSSTTTPQSSSQSQPPQHPPSGTPSAVPLLPRIRLKSAIGGGSTKIRIRNQRDVGLGYDSEASDREEDPHIEEQIILRLRPGEDAEYVRSCLERKEVPDMMIKFKGNLRRTILPALYDLYRPNLWNIELTGRSSAGCGSNTTELVLGKVS